MASSVILTGSRREIRTWEYSIFHKPLFFVFVSLVSEIHVEANARREGENTGHRRVTNTVRCILYIVCINTKKQMIIIALVSQLGWCDSKEERERERERETRN